MRRFACEVQRRFRDLLTTKRFHTNIRLFHEVYSQKFAPAFATCSAIPAFSDDESGDATEIVFADTPSITAGF